MKILMTGTNGFVGGILTKELKKKYEVIGIGRSDVPKSIVDRYYKWDISSEICPFINEIMDIDVIVHAAACISVDNLDANLITVNCVGTYNIFRLALEIKPKQVFYISSLPIIGIPRDMAIDENTSDNPLTMYHATKLAGENIIMQLDKYDITAISLRIPSPIAPSMPVKSILPLFIKKALTGENIVLNGKGTRKQNYLDVREIAKLIAENVGVEVPSGVYCLGAEETISNYELAELIIHESGSTSKILFSGKEDFSDGIDWFVDFSKATRLLGFQPIISIQKSVCDIIEYMKEKYAD